MERTASNRRPFLYFCPSLPLEECYCFEETVPLYPIHPQLPLKKTPHATGSKAFTERTPIRNEGGIRMTKKRDDERKRKKDLGLGLEMTLCSPVILQSSYDVH